MIPSIDDYDMTELKNLVEELQQESQLGQEDEEGTIDSSSKPKGGDNGGSGESDMNKSTLALFDKLQAKEDKELDDSVSSVRSSEFKRLFSRQSRQLRRFPVRRSDPVSASSDGASARSLRARRAGGGDAGRGDEHRQHLRVHGNGPRGCGRTVHGMHGGHAVVHRQRREVFRLRNCRSFQRDSARSRIDPF